MRVKPTTKSTTKIGIFSFIVISLLSILSIKPAFGQIDYFYGANTKGWRVSLGTGGTKLDANWSSNPVQAVGVGAVDYDFTPYISVGVEGQYGLLKGIDANEKLFYKSSKVTYSSGDIDFKIAVGQFTKLQSKNIFHDVLKRIYAGTGIGVVHSDVQLAYHYGDGGLPSLGTGQTISNLNSNTLKGSGSFTYVPLNIGTYIPLRRLTKKDKFEINVNYQYCFVMSPLFDGYRPNATSNVTLYNNGGTVNGNEGFEMFTVALRYKF